MPPGLENRGSSSSSTKDPNLHITSRSPRVTLSEGSRLSSSDRKDFQGNVGRNSTANDKDIPSYKRDPDPTQKELLNKRLSQSRRFSRDPYEPADISYEESQEGSSSNSPRRVRYPGSGWTHLFYDLAWTATFATLSQNGKFDKPMDYASYFAFFAAVLWLWASQTLYSIHFYTNDWFHLTSIFFQLFIFGMLAATTNGYEITTYITHLPGADNLDPSISGLTSDEEKERFAAERTDLLSARAMALAFASTRFLHLVQYLRACIYAKWGREAPKRNYVEWGRYIYDHVHPQLYAIVVGLIFSNMMFFAVVGIVFSDFGITKPGASLKLGLWVGGFSLEVLSHLWYPILRRLEFYWVWVVGPAEPSSPTQGGSTPESTPAKTNATGDITPTGGAKITNEDRAAGRIKTTKDANTTDGANPLPLVGVNLSERLDTITTIILGEGINNFAGTLTSILTAPGVKGVITTNVTSTAFIIWFIAYIYFEGPASKLNPDGEGLRRLIWMVTYLPFLASIFLLFVGIKNQFLLTSTISTADKTLYEFPLLLDQTGFFQGVMDPVFRNNTALKDYLFARGMIWSEEYDNLVNGADRNNQTDWLNRVIAWTMRISLSMIVNSYEIFNKDQEIPEAIQARIDAYNNNDTIPINDFKNGDQREMEFYQILTDILHGSLEGARYMLIFAAVILICLGIQSIVLSPLHDRYQCGVIFSRILMGTALAFLLLLNLGRYQEFYVPDALKNQRAGVFLWLDAFWILPTIAIAYGVQFLIEIGIAILAKRATLDRIKDGSANAAETGKADTTYEEPTSDMPQVPYGAAASPDIQHGKGNAGVQ